MPVNNIKGLNTNALLWSDNFESGNLNDWDYISPGSPAPALISSEQANSGTYSIKVVNGIDDMGSPDQLKIPNVSGALKELNFGTKVKAISVKFYINVLDLQDPSFFALRDTAGTNVMAVTPAREGDPSRRLYINGQLYTTLNVGEWYTLNVTNIDIPNLTLDFEVRDNVDALETSDTSVPINASAIDDIGDVAVFNQLSGDTGECFWDDIEIRGYGI